MPPSINKVDFYGNRFVVKSNGEELYGESVAKAIMRIRSKQKSLDLHVFGNL